jgi:hypothetical protein
LQQKGRILFLIKIHGKKRQNVLFSTQPETLDGKKKENFPYFSGKKNKQRKKIQTKNKKKTHTILLRKKENLFSAGEDSKDVKSSKNLRQTTTV